MSKVIKGKEILKMIAEGEIDENTKVTVDNYKNCTLGFVFEDGRNLFKWLDEDFELIEDETIDIDNIEPFTFLYSLCSDSSETLNEKIRKIVEKQNELIQA